MEEDETGEQIQRILDLLPNDGLTSHYKSLIYWLDHKFLPSAYVSWKKLTRYEQANEYIKWLEEERGEL